MNIKSITFLLFVVISLVVSSCDNQSDCCALIDVDTRIHYVNAAGENLINSLEEFRESNIKVYFKNGEDFEYVYNSNLDSPNMHRVDEDPDGNLVLTVYPSNYYEGNRSTTLIELNNGVVDTLVGEFELGDNREICTKAWLNGVPMTDRYIQIER